MPQKLFVVTCKTCKRKLLECYTDETTIKVFSASLANFLGLLHAPEHGNQINIHAEMVDPMPQQQIITPKRGLLLPQ